MRAVLIALVALAGCAGENGAVGDDMPPTCEVSLSYSPSQPVAAPTTEVRVDAIVTHAAGTLDYSWHVMKGGTLIAFDDAQADHSAISFLGDQSGEYDVTLDVTPSGNAFCPQGSTVVNVLSSADMHAVRLRVMPPAGTDAPLTDRPIQLHDAMDFNLGPVVLDTGVVTHGSVNQPAFLILRPLGQPDAEVQTFSDASGSFSVRVLDQPTEVIVVPETAGFAPKKVMVTQPGAGIALTVTAGDAISGSVKRGSTPIANAKVQLTIDGVPTTLGATDVSGNFSLRGTRVPGAQITVEVTPPAGSGLARLELTSDTLDLTQPVAVAYAAGILTRDLAGVAVRRGGSALAGKQVAIVGTVGTAGTIQGESASGTFRATVTTDAGGDLPALLAPAGPLHAVTTVAPGDLAVSGVDLTAGVPAQIDAPAAAALVTRAGGVTPLDGAQLDLVPSGPLALAGAPALHFVADLQGTVTGTIPAGGEYDVRWTDPQRRRAPYLEHAVAQIAASYLLPAPIFIKGELSVFGSENPVPGASVQILCYGCTGLDRSRPIAEMASDAHGAFVLAVPDPAASAM